MSEPKEAESGIAALKSDQPHMPVNALVLTGGGARAAYQVGVLQGISALRRQMPGMVSGNPFPIITGTSAGAINGTALACGADDFDQAVAHIAHVWSNLDTSQVYKADTLSMFGSQSRWRFILGIGKFISRWMRLHPQSLLDNAPLAELIERLVSFERLPQLLHTGQLQALAIAASSYSSGENVTFFQCDHRVTPWVRNLRAAVPVKIISAHLMASAAIPFVFPATELTTAGQSEYFGDGSMRQTAPLAPAIHLGARRILAIGAGRTSESYPPILAQSSSHSGYPSLAKIAGHAMASIFLDTLAADAERLTRINRTLERMGGDENNELHHVSLCMIHPSQSIDAIAARHINALPPSVRRAFLGTANDNPINSKAAAFASYLLFDASFTQELMALGRNDVQARQQELLDFFS